MSFLPLQGCLEHFYLTNYFLKIFKIIRHDKESDDITDQSFNGYDEAYDLLEEIYSDVYCSDVDYEDRPYYESIEVENENYKQS